MANHSTAEAFETTLAKFDFFLADPTFFAYTHGILLLKFMEVLACSFHASWGFDLKKQRSSQKNASIKYIKKCTFSGRSTDSKTVVA